MVRVLGLAILLGSSVAAQAQSPVERGKYLVDTVMTCHNLPYADGAERSAVRQVLIRRPSLR
jgi:hypothetical protein